MPAMIPTLEEQARVAEGIRPDHAVELVDARRRAPRETSAVVEDQGFAAPGRIPVRLVEVEEMRAAFANGVHMGRDGAAGRRVMPVEAELHLRDLEEIADCIAVVGAPKLADEGLPGLGDAQTFPVLEGVAIVGVLPGAPWLVESAIEQVLPRKIALQDLPGFGSDQVLWVHPRKGLGVSELSRIDRFECVQVEVFHWIESRAAFCSGSSPDIGGRRISSRESGRMCLRAISSRIIASSTLPSSTHSRSRS